MSALIAVSLAALLTGLAVRMVLSSLKRDGEKVSCRSCSLLKVPSSLHRRARMCVLCRESQAERTARTRDNLEATASA